MKNWKRGPELSRRPRGYEPRELPLLYPAVGASCVCLLLPARGGQSAWPSLSESYSCPSNQILLFLCEFLRPLRNTATAKANSARQRGGVAENCYRVGFHHGVECLAHKTNSRQACSTPHCLKY